ncbi:MAG TPA: S53 family peptidase [Candidatus Dormibacteraeota bacterium]|nr:S53 family peptidase [Candidatus Dormibacteraeota bacterium]
MLLGGPLQASAASMYVPSQLRSAYDVPANLTGSGQTIVIIAGYQSPVVQGDLAMFDAAFGLPPASLDIVAPDGTTPFNPMDPIQFGWAVEESSDVEWAHSIAPGAHLVLVEGKTGNDADLLSATKYAIDKNLGGVISMSFSEAESCPSAGFLADEHKAFERAAARGITLLAASGNHGPMQPTCDGSPVPAVGTPASDPLVTAVGGTNLTLDPSTGAYVSEEAWTGSGGGFSSVYSRPAYQAPFQKNRKARGVPDVAWHASPATPTPVVVNHKLHPDAGTSIATAQWAGVVALADQAAGHRLGAINGLLYRAAKGEGEQKRFHDLTSSKHGWDAVTGLGSPDVANLVAWIAGHAGNHGNGGNDGNDGNDGHDGE